MQISEINIKKFGEEDKKRELSNQACRNSQVEMFVKWKSSSCLF